MKKLKTIHKNTELHIKIGMPIVALVIDPAGLDPQGQQGAAPRGWRQLFGTAGYNFHSFQEYKLASGVRCR